MQENNLVLNNYNPIETVDNNNQDNNYTIFEVNSRKYAIKTQSVLEIVKLIELDYSHQMPSYILGIMEFEEKPVGVIDLREVFKKDRIIYDITAKIIVIKTNDKIVSIICDEVNDINKLEKYRIQQVPYQQELNFFDGLYVKDEQNIYILNIDNILDYLDKNEDRYLNDKGNSKYIVEDENSKDILTSRKNFLTTITKEVQTPTALYDRGVSFSINDAKYYINMASVKEFYKVNNAKFVRVPSTQDYIYGLLNIKGDYITILDLRRFLNCSKTKLKEKSTIIIINSEEYKLGILADEICESMNVDFDEIIQNRMQNQDDNITIEFVKDNEIYQALDIERLLQDDRLTIV